MIELSVAEVDVVAVVVAVVAAVVAVVVDVAAVLAAVVPAAAAALAVVVAAVVAAVLAVVVAAVVAVAAGVVVAACGVVGASTAAAVALLPEEEGVPLSALPPPPQAPSVKMKEESRVSLYRFNGVPSGQSKVDESNRWRMSAIKGIHGKV